jgi:hypothetical protein
MQSRFGKKDAIVASYDLSEIRAKTFIVYYRKAVSEICDILDFGGIVIYSITTFGILPN